MTYHQKPPLARRILRGAAMAVLSLAVMAVIAGILLWDADLYTARDRFEHLKVALFGEWQADNWCPPGRTSDDCDTVDSFAEALEAATDFTFFRSVPIQGTPHTVQTGIRFATAFDVVDGRSERQWCYVSIPHGDIRQQIDLATQSADGPPVYAELMSLDASALDGSDLDADALRLLARSHCRFNQSEDS